MQEEHSVHFLHIGKTGGTAVKYALSQHLAESPYAICLHGHDFKLRDVPQGEGFVFFLRDPIARFVSGFYSRQRQGQPRGLWPWRPEEREAFEHFGTPNELAMGLSSRQEENRTRAQEAMKRIRHVKNSYWRWFESEEYFRSRLSDVFFIGFQESLAEDFCALTAKLGLPDSELPDDDIHTHRNPRDLDTALESEAIENLKRWYQDDYRFVRLCKEFLAVPSE
jgi:hypothetical protein